MYQPYIPTSSMAILSHKNSPAGGDSSRGYVRLMLGLCLIWIELLCYIDNPLKDILFVSADSAAIPAKVGSNFNLVCFINDAPFCYKFIISVKGGFIDRSF